MRLCSARNMKFTLQQQGDSALGGAKEGDADTESVHPRAETENLLTNQEKKEQIN